MRTVKEIKKEIRHCKAMESEAEIALYFLQARLKELQGELMLALDEELKEKERNE